VGAKFRMSWWTGRILESVNTALWFDMTVKVL
jgi:hypothetical protein